MLGRLFLFLLLLVGVIVRVPNVLVTLVPPFLAPLALQLDLRRLLGREVGGDTEDRADLRSVFAAQHTGNAGAEHAKQRVDLHVVGRDDRLAQLREREALDEGGGPRGQAVAHTRRGQRHGHGGQRRLARAALAELGDLGERARRDAVERHVLAGAAVLNELPHEARH